MNRIALLAHIGKGNLGDEATLTAVLRNIALRRPGAEIRAFTLNPEDTRERHGVLAYPLRRPRTPASSSGSNRPSTGDEGGAVVADQRLIEIVKRRLKRSPLLLGALRRVRDGALAVPAFFSDLAFLFESSRRLKGTDMLVVVGGGQLGDYFGGAWGFPWTILKWTLLARLRGAEVVFLSVGAGPIGSRLSKTFFRWALTPARYRSFRDEGSRSLVESLGAPTGDPVFPDLVHGLPVDEPERRAFDDVVGGVVVGINPLPFQDSRYWAEADPEVYRRYVEKLATFTDWLIDAGHRVVLFPTQVIADVPVVRDVQARVQRGRRSLAPGSLTCPMVRSLDDLFRVIATTDLVVAGRFHGVVVSLLMSRPVVGLAYNKKTDELMTDVGMGEYVADVDRFDVAWLIDRFERIRDEADAAVDRIETRRAEYRAALDDQYDALFGPAVASLAPTVRPGPVRSDAAAGTPPEFA